MRGFSPVPTDIVDTTFNVLPAMIGCIKRGSLAQANDLTGIKEFCVDLYRWAFKLWRNGFDH